MVFSRSIFTSLVLSSLPFISTAGSDTSSLQTTPSKGRVNFNERSTCNGKYSKQEDIEVDTCVTILNSGYQIIQPVSPWPTCADGSDARFATYGMQNDKCDAKDMNPLEDKKDYLNTCTWVGLTGSFAFWCDGAVYKAPESDGKDHTASGGVLQWNEKKCNRRTQPKPKYYKPDTCIDVKQGMGLSFSRGAVCKNGTSAMVAGFKGKNCNPTSQPLEDPFTKWDDRAIGFCVPTEEVNSMAFWCDGFGGIDMLKPRKSSSNMGLIIGLSAGIGGALLIVMGLVVAYSINYHFREWVKKILGREDGYIAL